MQVSGLTRGQCQAYFNNEVWEQNKLEWLAPEAVADPSNTSQILWLYQPPWDLPHTNSPASLMSSAEYLPLWAQQNRLALKQRQAPGSKLMLVNSARISAPHALRHLLGEATADITATPPVTPPLSLAFEWYAPAYWKIYEALEAASWLGSGEPHFRAGQAMGLREFCAWLDECTKRRHAALAEAKSQQSPLNQDDECNDLRQENELLLLQLHQVQEELEAYYLQNVDLSKKIAATKVNAAK